MLIPFSATLVLCIASGMIGFGLTALIEVFKPTNTTHTY